MFRSSHPAKGDPQLDYTQLGAESPVWKITYLDGSPDAWLVVRHKDVCTVLTDERFSKGRHSFSRAAGPAGGVGLIGAAGTDSEARLSGLS